MDINPFHQLLNVRIAIPVYGQISQSKKKNKIYFGTARHGHSESSIGLPKVMHLDSLVLRACEDKCLEELYKKFSKQLRNFLFSSEMIKIQVSLFFFFSFPFQFSSVIILCSHFMFDFSGTQWSGVFCPGGYSKSCFNCHHLPPAGGAEQTQGQCFTLFVCRGAGHSGG